MAHPPHAIPMHAKIGLKSGKTAVKQGNKATVETPSACPRIGFGPPGRNRITLRAQRLKKLNLAWTFQSRLKNSISLLNFNLDVLNSPTGNRGLVGGLVAPYRAILRYYRCDTPYRAILFKGGQHSPQMVRYPSLALSFTQAHLCDAPFCNVSRDNCAIPHENKHEWVLRYYRYKYRAIWKVSLLGL